MHTHTQKHKAKYEIVHINARFNTVLEQMTTYVFYIQHLSLGLKIERETQHKHE